ncbi:interleukin-12 subunit beta [Spea bombifrons]|uniref:interleukin-12 subunit beta n=1 Tax=Spea bombifrons TaxID=233779 RepID=UPI00234AFBD0|nr:interleukin-12 subunit beta [Spea bombifrons]
MFFVNPLEGVWEFPLRQNTFVVDISKDKPTETVTLECNVSAEEQVYWQVKRQRRHGRTLQIDVKEKVDVGNFTCHTEDGDDVDYKSVVINNLSTLTHKKILSYSKHPIHCAASNYSGHFNCSWKPSKSHDQYFFQAERGSLPIACHGPFRHHSDYVVNCYDQETCSHGEENSHITFTLHAIQEKAYENHTKIFMLRDITRPDPPQDLDKSTKSGKVSLKWKYPKTWCNVHSFFPLIFNVNITNERSMMSEHHKDIEGTSLILPSKGTFHFCVQARDMYYNSSWSEWSCYM